MKQSEFEKGYQKAMEDVMAVLGKMAVEYDELAMFWYDEYQQKQENEGLHRYWYSAANQAEAVCVAMGRLVPSSLFTVVDGHVVELVDEF